jgi:hypothetical protein
MTGEIGNLLLFISWYSFGLIDVPICKIRLRFSIGSRFEHDPT